MQRAVIEDPSTGQPVPVQRIEGSAALPAADEGGSIFDQAAALEATQPVALGAIEGPAPAPLPAADEAAGVFEEAAALEGGVAGLEPAAGEGSSVFDEAAALEQQETFASQQPQDAAIGDGSSVFNEAAALEGSSVFDEAATLEQQEVLALDLASDPGAAPATPTMPAGEPDAAIKEPEPAAAEQAEIDAAAVKQAEIDAAAAEQAKIDAAAAEQAEIDAAAVKQAEIDAAAAEQAKIDAAAAEQAKIDAAAAAKQAKPSAAVTTISDPNTAAVVEDGNKIQTTGEEPELVVPPEIEGELIQTTIKDPIIIKDPVDVQPDPEPPKVVKIQTTGEETELVVPEDPKKEPVKQEGTAAAAIENQNTQGRWRGGLPAMPDLTGFVPPSRPARPLPYSGPGFPSNAKYQVISEIDLDLTSGRTTSTLVNQTPIEIEGGALAPSPNRAYIGRNISLVTDEKGQAIQLDHPERRYTRTSADPSYLYTRPSRKSGKPKNSKGRSSRGRGGHDIKMMGPPR